MIACMRKQEQTPRAHPLHFQFCRHSISTASGGVSGDCRQRNSLCGSHADRQFGDISARGIEVLRQVDLIAAEDTRHTRPLLRHLNIRTPMLAMYEHNEAAQLDKLMACLASGQAIALVSGCGHAIDKRSGISAGQECQRKGIQVSPVPGACAAVAALSASGLRNRPFLLRRVSPRTSGARQQRFRGLVAESATLVFYESSHRIRASLTDMATVFELTAGGAGARTDQNSRDHSVIRTRSSGCGA